MTVMQSEWKQACIETNLRFEPSRTLFGTTTKHRSFHRHGDVHLDERRGRKPARERWARTSVPTEANNWGGANFLAFADPRFDADVAARRKPSSIPPKNKSAWFDMQRIYADALPALPLFINAIPQVGADMAERLRPERHRAALHAAGGAVARRVGAIYFPGAVAGATMVIRTTSRTLRPPRLSPGTTMRRCRARAACRPSVRPGSPAWPRTPARSRRGRAGPYRCQAGDQEDLCTPARAACRGRPRRHGSSTVPEQGPLEHRVARPVLGAERHGELRPTATAPTLVIGQRHRPAPRRPASASRAGWRVGGQGRPGREAQQRRAEQQPGRHAAYFATITSDALITAIASSPTFSASSSIASLVIEEVTTTPWPISIRTWPVVSPL